MKTWEDYKNHVKSIDAESRCNMEEIMEIAAIVSSMIERRTALGISQRTLAERCGLPQSSVARIESFKTTPKIDTLLKLMQPLGLKLVVVKRFCNTSVQSTYVEHLASNSVRYPL